MGEHVTEREREKKNALLSPDCDLAGASLAIAWFYGIAEVNPS